MCLFVLVQRTAGSWRPWKPWRSTRTSWLQSCHKTRALRGNTPAFSTSGYIWSPAVQGGLQKFSIMFCVTPLDNLYMVPPGQGQMAIGYPSLESGPSALTQSSAGTGSTTSQSEDIPPLSPSLSIKRPQLVWIELCPARVLIQAKVFLHSGNGQQDLNTSTPVLYPFAQLLMQLCHSADRNSSPEAQLCLISLLNPFTPNRGFVFYSGRAGLRSWLCGWVITSHWPKVVLPSRQLVLCS